MNTCVNSRNIRKKLLPDSKNKVNVYGTTIYEKIHENNNDILAVLTGCIAMIFWSSDFYGVYNLSQIYKYPSKWALDNLI